MTALRKIHSLLTPSQRRSAAVLLGLMFVRVGLETLGLGLIIPAIALLMNSDLGAAYPVLQPALDRLGNPTHEQLIVGGMLALILIYLAKALFLGFLAWREGAFTSGVQVQLAQKLFATYLRQPYTFHLQHNSAQLMRNLTGEVDVFVKALGGLISLAAEGLVLAGVTGLLLMVEPLGAAIAVLILGPAAWGFHRATRARLTHWGLARKKHARVSTQHLMQGLGGAKDIKLLGREADFLAQYLEHNVKGARVARLQSTLQQFPRVWLELIAVVGLGALPLITLANGGDMTSILPTLGLFAAAAFRVMPSMAHALSAVQSLRYSLPGIDGLYEDLKLAAPEPLPKGAGAPLQVDIQVCNVRYSYPAAPRPALNGLTLRIARGECVGLVGPSGSGKSTLVDVILGLLPPEAGQVLVDGHDIQHNLRAWQDQIGYVPQSSYLTDDTLRRNVAFGLADAQIDDAAVRLAIRSAQLEEYVAGLPAGLETIVGERGVRLSGGQRQRIGIARALYHNPAVLVLDEATGALDAATERAVMQEVAALRYAKTVLIVAHRLSTVERCDRLYKLDQGRVVAEGTPAEVLTTGRLAPTR